LNAPHDSASGFASPAGRLPGDERKHNRQLQFLSETFPEGVVYQYTVTGGGERLLTYLGLGASGFLANARRRCPWTSSG